MRIKEPVWFENLRVFLYVSAFKMLLGKLIAILVKSMYNEVGITELQKAGLL